MADESVIYQALRSSSEFIAVLGGEDRIFPNIAPMSTPPPYCVYRLVTAIPEKYLAERSGPDRRRVQITFYGGTRPQARLLADTARAVLEDGYVGNLLVELEPNNMDETDAAGGGTLGYFAFLQDWSVWTQPGL